MTDDVKVTESYVESRETEPLPDGGNEPSSEVTTEELDELLSEDDEDSELDTAKELLLALASAVVQFEEDESGTYTGEEVAGYFSAIFQAAGQGELLEVAALIDEQEEDEEDDEEDETAAADWDGEEGDDEDEEPEDA